MIPGSSPVGSIKEMSSISQKQGKTRSPTTTYDPPPPEPPPPPPPNLPSDLLDYYHKFCVLASIRGDWGSDQVNLGKRPNVVGFGISENYNTALHIAATTNNSKLEEEFVKNLVRHLRMEQLELQNKNHNTVLCIAGANGFVIIVKTMVIKNMALVDISPDIPGSQGMIQLYMVCSFGEGDMVNYLHDNSKKMTSEFWTDLNRGWLLQKCVEADLFDVAEMGNIEFVVELIRHYPLLLWKKNDDGQTIFHVAVTYLEEGIYNLLHEIGSMKDMITPLNDEEGNNMLQLVLQMQRELVWFKEVEDCDEAQGFTLCK